MNMTENRVNGLVDDIKALKSSMPVAGSLLDLYFYTKTEISPDYSGGTSNYTTKFVPDNPEEGLGLTEMYKYAEQLAKSDPWAQYNPIFFSISDGYGVDQDGSAARSDSFESGGIVYNLKITVTVYSTVPGHIEIEFS